ncbi:MAG TPA: MarR family winged helix-turn-helix transcriptional regulator [Nitrolancea sp.]|nr:MarR family winged helix-turn-helix transcriptional regulator [Nitrolancea sp.]
MNEVNDNLMRDTVTLYARAARMLDPMRLQVWEEMGINFPQLRILFRVRSRPGIDLRTLAEQMGISASGASQQVDKLVERGFLVREDDPDDRRRLSLELTEHGQQATGEISKATRSYIESALSVLSDEELADFHRLLSRVLASAPGSAMPRQQ